MAMIALAAHKLRSGLTLLGVLVGVFHHRCHDRVRVLQENIQN